MQLHELITELSSQAIKDLTEDFDPRDPENEKEAQRKMEYWFQKFVIMSDITRQN